MTQREEYRSTNCSSTPRLPLLCSDFEPPELNSTVGGAPPAWHRRLGNCGSKVLALLGCSALSHGG